MAAAGVPDGVFNLVHGFGPDSAGEFLTRHPGVDAITFTGESATGSAIMRAAADGVKAVSFELGGKNAGLVFADADLDAAVAGSVRSSFTNGGQVCLCTERLYVQRPVFEEFAARLAKRAGELAYGWPADEATVNMPLISHSHRDKVLGYYDLARAEGADGAGRRRGAALRRRPRRRGVRAADRADRAGPGRPDQPRGDLRPGRATSRPSTTEDEAFALANDSRLRPGRDGLDPRRRAGRTGPGRGWTPAWSG